MRPPNDAIRTFTIPLAPSATPSSKPQHLTLHIGHPSHARSDLGDSTWSSSLVLARQLALSPPPPLSVGSPRSTSSTAPADTRHHILELGAGTGLAGLAAACAWRRRAVLTDFASVVPNLARNCVLNGAALQGEGEGGASAGGAVAAALDWRQPEGELVAVPFVSGGGGGDGRGGGAEGTGAKGLPRRFGTILAADTIYDAAHPALLAGVIAARLERLPAAVHVSPSSSPRSPNAPRRSLSGSPAPRVYLAYPLRVAYLDHIRETWTALAELGLVPLREGREEVGEEWDDERVCEWVEWGWKGEESE